MVIVVYWSFLYIGFKIREFDVVFYLLNLVFMLIEIFLSVVFVWFLYVVYVELYGVLYMIFIVVYWLSGGINIDGDNFIYLIFDYEDKLFDIVVFIIVYVLVGFLVF